MSEFIVGDYTYYSAPLLPIEHLNVIRRLSPALGPLAKQIMPAFDTIQGADMQELAKVLLTPQANLDDPDKLGAGLKSLMVEALAALGTAFGSLSDDASLYIIGRCLSQCRRSTPSGSRVEVWNKSSDRPQHTDITADQMLTITYYVLRENLSDFFRGLSSKLKTG